MALVQPCVEKIYITINAPAAFNIRQKILGDQNANLQYIVNETKANVSLRGRGSGFIEQNTGLESTEQMHIYIEHPVRKSLIEAKNYARNLLETVQQDLQVFMQTNQNAQTMPPPIVQATSNQQITIPSAILSVPPPNILQNNTIQPTHILQPPNFIPQSQIIPQPMQIIQQTPINIPPPTALNIPTIRAATTTPISVQFQGQPNIQIQPTGQQILLNQAPTQQYQLQYIPAQTIQQFNQPQQQIQGILQPNAQQFIALQGNTAFMLPPPNLVHSPQTIGTVFNAPPLTINQEDLTKADSVKTKIDEQKNIANPQQIASTSRTMINQPPPSIQQFLVNTNAWPQNQQMPIQIVTQPQQTIRSGNEILIQNAVPAAQGQQLLTAFSPHHGQSIQQIHFSNQPLITQPPPLPPQIQIQNIDTQQSQSAAIRPSQSSLSYQQQFEQKLSIINDSQRRAVKRKNDESEEDANKSFPKTGMGSMSKSRPPPIHPNQQMIKVTNNNRMITKPNSNSNTISADNISIINSKNTTNKNIFTKNISTSSNSTKSNISQADPKTNLASTVKNENDGADLPTSSTAIIQQNFEIQNQFMQPPPNIHFNQPRGVPPQMMMYQTQLPPPTIQQQQDLGVFQNNNFVQQLNRFNVPRGMIVQMNSVNENATTLSGNVNFAQPGQPRFRTQW